MPRTLPPPHDNVALESDGQIHTAQHANWALDRIDQRNLPLDRYEFDPRNCSRTLGAGVDVYVIDTGCDVSHAAFRDATISVETAPTAGYEAGDDNGHGTAVASLIVGERSGAAPRAHVTCIKALNERGTGRFSDVISSLERVVGAHMGEKGGERGVLVVLSLTARAGKGFVAMDRAVSRAARMGVVSFAAAGNEGEDACEFTPGRSEGAIGVGAVDEEDRMVGFSNTGRCVEAVGPGRGVLVVKGGGRGEGYTRRSGTSFATPLVAGVVALLWEEGDGLGGMERARRVLGGMGRIAGGGYRIATLKGGCHGGRKYRWGGMWWRWVLWGVGALVGVAAMVVGSRAWAWRKDRWWRGRETR